MNILMLNYEFLGVGGGGGVITYHVSRRMAGLGHDVTVITGHFRGLKRREAVDGVTVYRVWTTRRWVNIATYLDMMTYLVSASILANRLMRRKRFDHAFAFFALPTGALAYALKKIYGVPYTVSLYGSDVPGHNPYRFRVMYRVLMPLVKLVLRNAKGVVAISRELKRLALKIKPDLNISVVLPGVDPRTFHPGDGERKGGVRVLFVGRMDSVRKGIPYLLRAASAIRPKKPFEVLLVGDGPLRPRFERLSKELGLSNVRFLGAIYGDRMARLYRSCDVFTLPSLAEGTPVAVLEAMASGLPVVASTVGGIPDEVDEDCAILVPPRDVTALRDALEALINDDRRRKAMGDHARGRILKYFSWDAVTREYLKTCLAD